MLVILHRAYCTSSIPALVLPDVVQVQHERHDRSRRLRGQHCNFRRAVIRCVPRLEGLRPDDITDGERARDGGGGESPFRLAGTVGGSPVVDDWEGSDDGVDEVDADEEASGAAGR